MIDAAITCRGKNHHIGLNDETSTIQCGQILTYGYDLTFAKDPSCTMHTQFMRFMEHS